MVNQAITVVVDAVEDLGGGGVDGGVGVVAVAASDGEAIPVSVDTAAVDTVTVLIDAIVGDVYAGLLQASIVSDTSGVTVGASAGTRLTFTVKPSSLLEGWLLRLRGIIEENSLTVAIVIAALGLGGVGWWARRTFSFRFERR